MGKNEKVGSFKIVDKAMRILDSYRTEEDNPYNLVFPELKKLKIQDNKIRIHKSINNTNKSTNEALGKIASKMKLQKPLTMHIARYIFGNLRSSIATPQS